MFSEGSDADALYIVVSGRIAISNKNFDGRESMVALMERGDLFGEMSLFDGLGRSAEARALEPSAIVVIPFAPLRMLWEDHPELLWRVIAMLTRRLRAMDEALADSFFLDVTGRTAKHLLDLAGERDEFEIPITQEELAGLVGRQPRAGQQGDLQLPAPRLDRAAGPALQDPQAPRARSARSSPPPWGSSCEMTHRCVTAQDKAVG